MSWLPVLVCSFIAIASYLFRPLLSSTRNIPGPLLAKWTDLWYLWSLVFGDFEKRNASLHAEHGPIVRYGPNRFSFSDGDAVSIIYKHGASFAKSSWYDTWAAPGSWSIFSDRSIKHHAQTRRLYQSTYSMSSMLNYEQYVDECTDIFHQRLEEISCGGTRVDMRHWFQCYAFDVISMITYAKRIGFLDKGEDVGGIINSLDNHLVYASCVGIYPSLHRFLYRLRNLQAGGRGAGRAHIISFTQKCIDDHLAERKNNHRALNDGEASAEPFLSKFATQYFTEPKTFTRQHILAGCAANMVAGSDTTAISLSATLYYLMRSPKCLETLKAEIREFTVKGHLSPKPRFKETLEMPYLQATLKEALRLHPATGLPLERVVPEGGAVICGRPFPAGSIVGVNTWVLHRDRSVFGEDVDVFNPNRWLTASSEQLEIMNRYWFPFGLGSRTCIGRHVSMLEMSKLVPRLLRDFNFEFAKPGDHGENDWQTENFWFVKPTNFTVKISRIAATLSGV